MSIRKPNILGVVSAVVLAILVTLEFWIPFRHLWDVQMVGFVINAAASFYAAKRGSSWWYFLVAANLVAIVGWVLALGG